jgi:hypothetical protein
MRTANTDAVVVFNIGAGLFKSMADKQRWACIEGIKEDIISDLVNRGIGVVFQEENNPQDRNLVRVVGYPKLQAKYQAWTRIYIEEVKTKEKGEEKIRAQEKLNSLMNERDEVLLDKGPTTLDRGEPSRDSASNASRSHGQGK